LSCPTSYKKGKERSKLGNRNEDQRAFIIGCQRSGTTLLRLILDVHPDISCYDELVAYDVLGSSLPHDPFDRRLRVFKIPRWTEQLLAPTLWDPGLPAEAPNFYAGQNAIFMLRDPRDVVSSMMRLSGGAKSWLETYPPEIIAGKMSRDPEFREAYGDVYEAVLHYSYPGVALGALYWQYKTDAYLRYRAKGLPIKLIRYEHLVSNPEAVLRDICRFLGVPWVSGLMAHERYPHGEIFPHGLTVGETNPASPIFTSSVGAWEGTIPPQALQDIDRITAETWNAVLPFVSGSAAQAGSSLPCNYDSTASYATLGT
jgi:hypothetical protein